MGKTFTKEGLIEIRKRADAGTFSVSLEDTVAKVNKEIRKDLAVCV